MTSLHLRSGSASSLDVDAVVVGVTRQDGDLVLAPGAEDVDKAFKKRLVATLRDLGAQGSAGEVTKVATLGATRAPVVVAVGLGDAPAPTSASDKRGGVAYEPEVLRRAAGAVTRELAGTGSVGYALPASDVRSAAAVAEGALLGAYAFLRYRTTDLDKHRPPVGDVTVLTPLAGDKEAKAATHRAEVVTRAVHLARDLVNTPPSDLHPRELADAAAEAARKVKVDVEVLDETALREGGYGGILGVGQGSVHPPRLVRLAYTGGRRGKKRRHLVLVGKGITFDSGGLSLKPSQAMQWMKADMGGAAAVVAATLAIAELGLPVDVTCYAPLAENMPSGTAQRPSDVLTTYGGKTVEVLNTDAEGRLVLADAIVRACEDQPDLLVDAATLTGAQLIALGARTAAIMSNDDDVRSAVHAAADKAGEAMWPMPLPKELRASMDSEVADIANIGDRNGGMLVAGLFLQDFVPEGVRWAHLDIAGPAFNDGKPHGYTPKGGTGAAVRTLVQLADDLAAGVL